MTTPFLNRLATCILPCAVVYVAACSSAPSAEEPSSTGSASTTDDTPSTAREAARVQDFLDARYTAKDVRYSFHTRAGQDIDCVDFFAEPGVRARAAQGRPFTSIPKPGPVPEALKKRVAAMGPRPEDDIAFHGQPDVNGRPEQCPEGSIPEVRITKEAIARVGGLDAYVQHQSTKAGPLRPPPPPGPPGAIPSCSSFQSAEYANYAHVVGTLVMGQTGIDNAASTMAIYGPSVPYWSGDHSLSEVWLYSGSNTSVNGVACTSDCVESIEIGWDVDDSINLGDTTTPHLFLFSTNNGYNTGCYNNSGNCGPVWTPVSTPGAQFALNGSLSYNPPGNTGGQDPQGYPVELYADIFLSNGQYQVWLQIGSQYAEIGYYEASDYAPMDTVQVGGEVEHQSGSFNGSGVQMGSGNAAAAGFGWAAYEHDYIAEWPEGGYQFDATMCATRPNDYSESTTAGAGLSTWGQYFYYGGTPPATCVPTTCSEMGATCGSITNDCGGTLSCGSCPLFFSCENNTCTREIFRL